jgi:EAL domain-containing protein (putative c-di-GMP-specific phosphodiesterase class I)
MVNCDKICSFSEDSERMIDFTSLPLNKNDLERLAQLKIDMVFQPIYNAANFSILGFEALMRPEGKPPMDLIAEYQEADQLSVIELATCFGATMEYRKRGYTQPLCINSLPSEGLSDEQYEIYYKIFPEMVGNIIVEIVEYTELNKHKWATKKRDIDTHGLQIALDDYSTGNNDITAFDFFRPQFIKLDRSLISNIDTAPEKQTNVLEMVSYFRDVGVRVVAEGIETMEELEFLRHEAKVDFLQGFYLGKPQ